MFFKKIVVLALLVITVDARGVNFDFLQVLFDHLLLKASYFMNLFGLMDQESDDKLMVEQPIVEASLSSVSPDINKSFQEIATENGYSFESHPVTTEDGYILNVFRISSDNVK